MVNEGQAVREFRRLEIYCRAPPNTILEHTSGE